MLILIEANVLWRRCPSFRNYNVRNFSSTVTDIQLFTNLKFIPKPSIPKPFFYRCCIIIFKYFKCCNNHCWKVPRNELKICLLWIYSNIFTNTFNFIFNVLINWNTLMLSYSLLYCKCSTEWKLFKAKVLVLSVKYKVWNDRRRSN